MKELEKIKMYMAYGDMYGIDHNGEKIYINNMTIAKASRGEIAVKPVLYPLSLLNDPNVYRFDKLFDENTRKAIGYLYEASKDPHNNLETLIGGLLYRDVMKLIKERFDVFGLIEKKAAASSKEA